MPMVRTITFLICLMVPAISLAVPPWVSEQPTAWKVQNAKVELSIKGGGALFLQSDNTIKINARMEATYLFSKDTSFGLEGLGMVTGNNDYQLLGAYLVMRAYIVNEDDLSFWIKSGLGGGPGPPSLNSDGVTRHNLEGLVQLGLGLSYAPWNHRVSFGVEAIQENLSMVSLLATLGIRL